MTNSTEKLEHTHSHCVHEEPENQLTIIENYCIEQGLRLTALRKEVLQIIIQHQGAIGAYDILALLKNRPKPAAPPTVYRTLDFLLEHGLVHRLASINAYIPCCHPRETHEAAFLICKSCEKVIEFSKRPLFSELSEFITSHEFKPYSTTVEVQGRCSDCQEEKEE